MKTAIVTGASRGIGKSIVEKLLDQTWNVYGVSRTQPSVTNENFHWISCDLRQPADIKAKLHIEESAIDLFVSNAGAAYWEPATDISEDSYAQTYNINVLAPMLIIAKLKAKLEKATIISISSVSDRLVEPNFALYCSSKAANTRYFETLAQELVGAKIFSLLPDYIDTPMLRTLQEGNDFDWDHALRVEDMTQIIYELTTGRVDVESGSNIIVVNDHLAEDLETLEKLYGYNVSTGELRKL